jgi:hypothetical protein
MVYVGDGIVMVMVIVIVIENLYYYIGQINFFLYIISFNIKTNGLYSIGIGHFLLDWNGKN